MTSKGRWSGDIAYTYARSVRKPEMDRAAVRAMGMTTDASPFVECADPHWASISAWTEGAADLCLGDAEEFDEGDEPLSDDEDEDEGDDGS